MSDNRWSTELNDVPDDEFVRLEAELGRMAREMTAEDWDLVEPPADLWSHISVATSHTGREGETAEDGTVTVGFPASDSSEVVDLLSRRRAWSPSPGTVVGIAASLLVLVVGAGVLLRTGSSGGGLLVAQAEVANTGLPVPFDGSGSARLERDGDDLYLELDLPGLPASAGEGAYYEVWMIDTNVEGMISLGGLGGAQDGSVRVDMPDNVDHRRFPVVDISVEPLDGDPTHSGQSVLRGVLVDSEEA